MGFAAFLATALAAALCYVSTRHQRWLAVPLPPMPSRASAALAAMVGLRAWMDVLPLASAIFAWLAALMLISMAASASGSLRQS